MIRWMWWLRVLRRRGVGPMYRSWRMHRTLLLGIGHLVHGTTVAVLFVLGHRRRMAWVRSWSFGPRSLLLVRRTLPPVDLITIVINIDWLDSIPFVGSLHMLRRRTWILWARLLVARARWIRSTRRSTGRWVAILRLKRDGLLSVGWFLPRISHRVSLADESPSQAVVTC